MIKTLKQHQFLFRELVKRDFRQKYKKLNRADTFLESGKIQVGTLIF